MCLQEEPSCTSGCTSLEAAMPDCARAALDAYNNRLREIKQAAKDCATDACWNPADDGTTRGQGCGDPNRCRGQSVALCTEDKPDCMCRTRNTDVAAGLGAALRGQMWSAYCTRANDERCDSPIPPGGFLDSSGAPPPSPRPAPAKPAASSSRVTLGGGSITISSDGTVTLGRPAGSGAAGATDPDCMSLSCRASQRGDW